jgi:hypothetical protein
MNSAIFLSLQKSEPLKEKKSRRQDQLKKITNRPPTSVLQNVRFAFHDSFLSHKVFHKKMKCPLMSVAQVFRLREV